MIIRNIILTFVALILMAVVANAARKVTFEWDVKSSVI